MSKTDSPWDNDNETDYYCQGYVLGMALRLHGPMAGDRQELPRAAAELPCCRQPQDRRVALPVVDGKKFKKGF